MKYNVNKLPHQMTDGGLKLTARVVEAARVRAQFAMRERVDSTGESSAIARGRSRRRRAKSVGASHHRTLKAKNSTSTNHTQIREQLFLTSREAGIIGGPLGERRRSTSCVTASCLQNSGGNRDGCHPDLMAIDDESLGLNRGAV